MPDSKCSVRIDLDGDIAELWLTRPDLLNRIDEPAHAELLEAFRQLEDMKGIRAIVFAAEGRVFSAGGDFDLMLRGNAELNQARAIVDEGGRLLAALLEVAPPIVVALHGSAIGLGATLALSCDAVVSHAGVEISDPHVNIGLVAGDGGCLVWPQTVGMLRAKRHLLTGDPLTGEEAYRIGVVTDLVPSVHDVLPCARTLAHRIASLPPIAVQGTKKALNAVLRHRFEEVMTLGLELELTSMRTADLREAVAAFRNRRAPTYEGH